MDVARWMMLPESEWRIDCEQEATRVLLEQVALVRREGRFALINPGFTGPRGACQGVDSTGLPSGGGRAGRFWTRGLAPATHNKTRCLKAQTLTSLIYFQLLRPLVVRFPSHQFLGTCRIEKKNHPDRQKLHERITVTVIFSNTVDGLSNTCMSKWSACFDTSQSVLWGVRPIPACI